MIALSAYSLSSTICEDDVEILYRGHRKADSAPVAIKILRGEYPRPEDLARIRHEYTILKDLNVPGVVRAHTIGIYERGPALILDELSGIPLHAVLAGERLPLEAALWIGSSLAHTLAALHGQHVIHKDIKPRNILLDKEARSVTLINFGFAARLSEEASFAERSSSSPHGSLAYISPEQTGRINRAIDPRADLYSLGVTLYEILTGTLPFRDHDPVDLIHSHIARTPPPPSEIAPSIPALVSDLVMKLLEKAAEDRYQSAEGLQADLLTCLDELRQRGTIEPFPLGRSDRALRIPVKLYGREAELAELEAAFDRASLGAVELVLIWGPAGSGKSALRREVEEATARRGGFFGGGELGELGASVPYAGIAAALSAIVRQILAESPASLARYRALIEEALGADAALLVDLVPSLELCIQPAAAAGAPPTAQARPRMGLALQRLLRALSTERTVVLFLDNLDAADAATPSLLPALLSGLDGAHVLILGTCREGGLDEAHPLGEALRTLRRSGAAVRWIELGPLSLASVTAWLADALMSDEAMVSPLAELLSDKTHGSPFFLGQLLSAIHREGLLYLDARAGAWAWDEERIKEVELTENVVDFLVGKMKRLPERTQRILSLAACIGRSFDERRLAATSDLDREESFSDLQHAIDEGLVLPLGVDRALSASDVTATELDARARALNVAYRFSHERVHAAAASLLDEDQRAEVHLRLGRLLREELPADKSGDTLLSAVNHLNLGAAKIHDRASLTELARNNLEASRRAKARMAYELGADYLAAGIALLDDETPGADAALASALYTEQAECAALAGRFDEARAAYRELIRRAATDADRALIESALVILYTSMGRPKDAIALGQGALGRLGIELPDDEEAIRAQIREELAAIAERLGGRTIEALADAPVLEGARERAILKLLMDLWMPGAVAVPALRTLVAVMHVHFSLRYGHSEASSFGYMAYGSYLARVLGKFEDARAFGRLALTLDERSGSAEASGALYLMFGGYAHLVEPVHVAARYLERAYQGLLAAGDLYSACIAASLLVTIRMSVGDGLASLGEEVSLRAAILRRRGVDEITLSILSLCETVLLNLTGRAASPGTLDSDELKEARCLDAASTDRLEYLVSWRCAYKVMLSFLYEDHRGAVAMARQAEVRLESARSSYLLSELNVFAFLSLAALLPRATPEEAALYERELVRHEAKISTWAAHCPANYKHRLLLVRAERARLEGRELSAMELYDQAIEAARAGEFLRDEAVASEVAARFYQTRGRSRIARAYLGDARNRYIRWGAVAKVAALDEAHGELLGLSQGRSEAPGPPSLPGRDGKGLHSIDVLSVARAAQTIASEILLDKVLDRLLRITLANAGAQRGVLLLEQDGHLRIEATITLTPDEVRMGPAVPLAEAGHLLAVSIVQYVERTGEAVVIGNAQRDPRFRADPYLSRAGPRSILCLTMANHGRMMGALYLENNVVADAFTPARLEICRLLSSQAAIAVENALLYTHVQAVTEQLWSSNERLEQEVVRRTEELRIELGERVKAEEARATLKEEIIRVQNERLLELSTPLIPISAKVMVMPLIGAIDAERAYQILETALRGASRDRAKVVIVDITGVRQVGAEVASSLVRTASALGLLGAEAVITGIRPEVAETLVGLGISLGTVVTRGTLESGIAYAFSRTGTQLVPGPRARQR